MYSLDPYAQKILEGWEEVVKKGQLTFWILLSLKDGEKTMRDMTAFIESVTHGTITADEKSMYRAVRRFEDIGLIQSTKEKGRQGPDIKVLSLTDYGHSVLSAFIQRNIMPIYLSEEFKRIVS